MEQRHFQLSLSEPGLCIAAEKGPTILVVRDKQGHVFGGYASDSWTKNGKFFGEVIVFPHRS